MKKSIFPQRLETFCVLFLNFLCLLLFAFLFYHSFISSWLNHELTDEYVYFQRDSLPGNLLGLLLALGFLAILVRLLQNRVTQPGMNRLALALSLLTSCISIGWVLIAHTSPQADQELIVTYANQFNAGNFEALKQDGYVGMYQQQLGIITVLRVLAKIAPLFHTEGWRLFQLFSAVTTGLIVYAGYHIVARITHQRPAAELIYLLFACLCAPMYIYTPFVYGESSSTAFSLLACWMLLECLHAPRARYWIGLFFGCMMAVLLRTNTIIIMIALGIVLVIKLLRQPSKDLFMVGIVFLLGVFAPTLLINALYHDKIPEDSKPMPAMLHITMGINDTVTNAGWYDSYNLMQYQANGFDPSAATAAAKKDFSAFVAQCESDPAYAADFYYRKISSQWNAPLYQCIVMNNHIEGEQSPLVQSIYQGLGNRILTAYMNLYQLLIYGGVLLFTLLSLKKHPPLETNLLLIAVFGGFLFSVLWEAKTRYVFPYFMLMLPCAAIGLSALLTGFWQHIDARNV